MACQFRFLALPASSAFYLLAACSVMATEGGPEMGVRARPWPPPAADSEKNFKRHHHGRDNGKDDGASSSSASGKSTTTATTVEVTTQQVLFPYTGDADRRGWRSGDARSKSFERRRVSQIDRENDRGRGSKLASNESQQNVSGFVQKRAQGGAESSRCRQGEVEEYVPRTVLDSDAENSRHRQGEVKDYVHKRIIRGDMRETGGNMQFALQKDPDGRIISATTRADAAARLLDLRNQILSGQAAFADLAARHSDCSSSKRGRDLGMADPLRPTL
ncbi:hypothetical protein EJB05_28910, partial [Eragrostis curvula]